MAPAAMAVLPLVWTDAANRQASAAYLAFLGVELLVVVALALLLARRWPAAGSLPPEPLGRYDRDGMTVTLEKRAARDRATIRGAIAYRGHHEAASLKSS